MQERIDALITELDEQIQRTRDKAQEEIKSIQARRAALVQAKAALTPDLLQALAVLQRIGLLKRLL